MKKGALLGMLVMVLAFVMTVVGCDNGTATSANDPFAGAWASNVHGIEARIVASNGNWRQYIDNAEAVRGTYTFSGNNVTVRIVHVIPALVFAGANQWVVWVELEPIVQEHLGGSAISTATVSGNTLSIQGMTFSRQ